MFLSLRENQKIKQYKKIFLRKKWTEIRNKKRKKKENSKEEQKIIKLKKNKEEQKIIKLKKNKEKTKRKIQKEYSKHYKE